MLHAAVCLGVLTTSAAALPPTELSLQALSISTNTADKPQSKVWSHGGTWWCVLPNSSGTWVWRLDGTAWTSVLKLSNSTTTKTDVKALGDVTHVLLFQGTTSELSSIEYVPASQTYQLWTARPGNVSLTLDSGVETATLDVDSQGRMWIASDEVDEIMVRHSESPYSSWSGPISLASGINSDDICVISALPGGTVGVLWSNQNSRRFGFRTHADGALATEWSADEVPASQSALPVGLGMADDHLNLAVASDGTLYAAVKTSYDTGGYPKIALLVRRPSGVWDDLYGVDEAGTRGIVLLDEGTATVTVVYTSVEGSGNIVYKESPTSSIAFGSTRTTLIAGSLNEASSTKQNINGSIVILASTTGTPLSAVGVLRTSPDTTPPSVSLTSPNGGEVWPVGSTHDVMWLATDDIGVTAIDLEYSTDGGSSWIPMATGLANTGSYPWSIPNAPTTQARVRVTARDALSNQAQDVSNAEFEIQALPGHVITAGAGANGSIAPSGAVVVADGDSITFTMTPNSGFVVTDLLVDDVSVGALTGYTFTNVIADHTIFVTFAPDSGAVDLVGWWPMEENGGTAILDASGQGNNGSLPNGGSWTLGAQALALVLNGTNQYALVPDDDTLDLTGSITMAAWIRPAKVGTQNVIAKAVFGATDGYELNLSSGGKPFVRFNQRTSADTYRINGTTSYPADGATWMHLAATFDGSTMRLYVNGVLEGSLAMPVPIGANNLPLGIGAQSDGAASRLFQGAIDEARVYSRALSAAEIPTLMDHSITASAGANGAISPAGLVTVSHGGSATFTITPDPGSFVADVLVDGASVGPVTSYTFANVTRSHTISATFASSTVTITASAGGGGSISPSGAVVVPLGGSRTFSITPDGDHHISDVLVDGLSVGAVSSYTFQNVQVDHTIAAIFALDGALVGWWPMEEGGGTSILDHSGHGNDGTLANGPVWTGGIAGLALVLNGTNQYASVAANVSLDMTNAITMAAWIRPGKFATQDLIKKAVNGGTNGYEFSLSAPTSTWPQKVFVRFNQVASGDTYRVNSTTLYPYDGNTWIHVAATYDGATIRLYVNGMLEGSLAMPGPIATNSLPLGIGAQSDGARGFQGAMDDVRLYGRALTDIEIQALLGHTITASAGSGGSISPSGTIPVHHGGTQAFSIVADTCYVVADVEADGISVGPVLNHTFENVTGDHTIVAAFGRETFTITASAGVGGTIAPTGDVPVDCGADQTFLITPDPRYDIEDVLVDGISIGPLASYTFTNVHASGTIAAAFRMLDLVAAVPGDSTVISTVHPCVTIPVVFSRSDLTPMRGYSVTLELSPNLSLCGAGFQSAEYTQAPRHFLVTALGGNRWTVDELTLGSPCGITGSAPIFTVDVTSAEVSGTGTISVVSVLARDCWNDPVPATPGAPASIPIDKEAPAQTTDLTATQVKTGNYVPPPGAPHGTTPIRLEFGIPVDAAGVEVYRKAFGGYPQYDEVGGGTPELPGLLPDSSWTLTPVMVSGETDEPPTRDFWYYALVTTDAGGNVSSVSNMTGGTLNYHLGDVSTGLETCAGDDWVSTADMSLLGSHYGATLAVSDSLECIDVGPTTDLSTDGRPTTDNVLEFEDLMMFALNFEMVSASGMGPLAKGVMNSSGDGLDRLTLEAPGRVVAGEFFDAGISLHASGELHGLSVKLEWNESVAAPVRWQTGGFFEGAGGVVLSAAPGSMDGVVLGSGSPGLAGDGVLGVVTFRALTSGNPGILVETARARDGGNRELPLNQTVSVPEAPIRVGSWLAPATPTPFASSTTLEYGLAATAHVELAVFGIDGRRVRTLQSGSQPPGIHRFTWDGEDDQGRRVASGMYIVRLSTGKDRFTRSLIRLQR